jgi:hypothetical protein
MFNIVVMFGVLVTVLIRPEAEIWYYGASVLMLVLVVLNFNEILNNYNYLAMREMPQFRKKGEVLTPVSPSPHTPVMCALSPRKAILSLKQNWRQWGS